MVLQNKNAIVYGGGGLLGATICRSFARAGARVFVTGHRSPSIQKVVDEINASGGLAEAAIVDALDGHAVREHLESVVRKAGTVDISFNGINVQDKMNIPLVEMEAADFVRPVQVSMQTQFLTATAAGRVMMKQRSGMILSLTATPGGIGYSMTGGFGPTCCAVEGFSRDLACELGLYGVRVVNIRSAGSPDSRPFVEALKHDRAAASDFINRIADDTMLKQLPSMEDIANVATFLASPLAAKITGVTIDVTCGTTTAINRQNPIPFVFE